MSVNLGAAIIFSVLGLFGLLIIVHIIRICTDRDKRRNIRCVRWFYARPDSSSNKSTSKNITTDTEMQATSASRSSSNINTKTPTTLAGLELFQGGKTKSQISALSRGRTSIATDLTQPESKNMYTYSNGNFDMDGYSFVVQPSQKPKPTYTSTAKTSQNNSKTSSVSKNSGSNRDGNRKFGQSVLNDTDVTVSNKDSASKSKTTSPSVGYISNKKFRK